MAERVGLYPTQFVVGMRFFEQLTEDEMSFTPLTSLHVCSSSVDGVEGLKRVHEWFESKKALAGRCSRLGAASLRARGFNKSCSAA